MRDWQEVFEVVLQKLFFPVRECGLIDCRRATYVWVDGNMCMRECTFLPLVPSTRTVLGNDGRGLTVGWNDLSHLRMELIYSVSPKSCYWTGTMLYPCEPQVGIE